MPVPFTSRPCSSAACLSGPGPLPVEAYPRAAGNRDGYARQCKKCRAAYYVANATKVKIPFAPRACTAGDACLSGPGLLPAEAYSRHKGVRDGYARQCKKCRAVCDAKYHAEHPEEARAHAAKYHARHRDEPDYQLEALERGRKYEVVHREARVKRLAVRAAKFRAAHAAFWGSPNVESRFCVYSHNDPRTGECYYIGKGTPGRAFDLFNERRSIDHITHNEILLLELNHTLNAVVQLIKGGLTDAEATELEYNMLADYRLKHGKLPSFNKNMPRHGLVQEKLSTHSRVVNF